MFYYLLTGAVLKVLLLFPGPGSKDTGALTQRVNKDVQSEETIVFWEYRGMYCVSVLVDPENKIININLSIKSSM